MLIGFLTFQGSGMATRQDKRSATRHSSRRRFQSSVNIFSKGIRDLGFRALDVEKAE